MTMITIATIATIATTEIMMTVLSETLPATNTLVNVLLVSVLTVD